jgi:hypothetical protein
VRYARQHATKLAHLPAMTKDKPVIPNAETVAAMEAAWRGEFTGSFATVADLMTDLNAPEPPVDIFQFTSLFSTSTNLPVTIWISVHGFVTTDPRDPAATNPAGVKAWIELNRDALLAHWRGELDQARSWCSA